MPTFLGSVGTRRLLGGLRDPTDEGAMLLQNVGIYQLIYDIPEGLYLQ